VDNGRPTESTGEGDRLIDKRYEAGQANTLAWSSSTAIPKKKNRLEKLEEKRLRITKNEKVLGSGLLEESWLGAPESGGL